MTSGSERGQSLRRFAGHTSRNQGEESDANDRGNCYFTCVVRVAPLGITNVAIAFIGVFPLLMPS